MDIIAKISEELGIKRHQTEAAVKLIDEGNTIPFIAMRCFVTCRSALPI